MRLKGDRRSEDLFAVEVILFIFILMSVFPATKTWEFVTAGIIILLCVAALLRKRDKS